MSNPTELLSLKQQYEDLRPEERRILKKALAASAIALTLIGAGAAIGFHEADIRYNQTVNQVDTTPVVNKDGFIETRVDPTNIEPPTLPTVETE